MDFKYNDLLDDFEEIQSFEADINIIKEGFMGVEQIGNEKFQADQFIKGDGDEILNQDMLPNEHVDSPERNIFDGSYAEEMSEESILEQAQQYLLEKIEEHAVDDLEEYAVDDIVQQYLLEKIEEHAGDDIEEHAGDDLEEHGGDDIEEHAGDDIEERAGDDIEEHAGDDLEEIIQEQLETNQDENTDVPLLIVSYSPEKQSREVHKHKLIDLDMPNLLIIENSQEKKIRKPRKKLAESPQKKSKLKAFISDAKKDSENPLIKSSVLTTTKPPTKKAKAAPKNIPNRGLVGSSLWSKPKPSTANPTIKQTRARIGTSKEKLVKSTVGDVTKEKLVKSTVGGLKKMSEVSYKASNFPNQNKSNGLTLKEQQLKNTANTHISIKEECNNFRSGSTKRKMNQAYLVNGTTKPHVTQKNHLKKEDITTKVVAPRRDDFNHENYTNRYYKNTIVKMTSPDKKLTDDKTKTVRNVSMKPRSPRASDLATQSKEDRETMIKNKKELHDKRMQGNKERREKMGSSKTRVSKSSKQVGKGPAIPISAKRVDPLAPKKEKKGDKLLKKLHKHFVEDLKDKPEMKKWIFENQNSFRNDGLVPPFPREKLTIRYGWGEYLKKDNILGHSVIKSQQIKDMACTRDLRFIYVLNDNGHLQQFDLEKYLFLGTVMYAPNGVSHNNLFFDEIFYCEGTSVIYCKPDGLYCDHKPT